MECSSSLFLCSLQFCLAAAFTPGEQGTYGGQLPEAAYIAVTVTLSCLVMVIRAMVMPSSTALEHVRRQTAVLSLPSASKRAAAVH